MDKDRGGVLPPGVLVPDFVNRDTAALHSSAGVVLAREHGLPFEKAQGVAADGAPPTSPDAGQFLQVKVQVDAGGEAGVPTAAKAAAGGRGGDFAIAVVGIIAASSAVTMVVGAAHVRWRLGSSSSYSAVSPWPSPAFAVCKLMVDRLRSM
uniref:Uncharacterized protein n=1 Tax=Oryza brachyantha TaxID=4533 RepID=J3MQX3_ORYBR